MKSGNLRCDEVKRTKTILREGEEEEDEEEEEEEEEEQGEEEGEEEDHTARYIIQEDYTYDPFLVKKEENTTIDVDYTLPSLHPSCRILNVKLCIEDPTGYKNKFA